MPVESVTFLNTDVPRGSLGDQGTWQGKGLTQRFSAGANVTWGILEIQLAPVGYMSQNQAVDTLNLTMFSSGARSYIRGRTNEIDLPARISTQPIYRVLPGQSFVRLNLWRVSVGASTENHWWGPGVRNSIMLGHEAPGFRHAYLKTNRPIPIGIGTVEGTYLGGVLDDTDINKAVRNGEWVYFNGIHASFNPVFFPGLHVGLTRTFIINGSDLKTWSDYTPIMQPFDKSKLGAGTDGGGSQPDDQRASVFFSWTMNEGGFRVYGEFAKEDHNADLRDIIGEPEHNRAYQFGVQKRGVLGQWKTETGVEITHLTMSNTLQTRSSGMWYVHSKVHQGYTHQGQVLGAGIGPGSNSLTLWSSVRSSDLALGGFAERVVVNRDMYNAIRAPGLAPETDYRVGVHSNKSWTKLRADVALTLTHTRNRFYQKGDHRMIYSIQTGVSYAL
jgi:hypothetical protein